MFRAILAQRGCWALSEKLLLKTISEKFLMQVLLVSSTNAVAETNKINAVVGVREAVTLQRNKHEC